MPETSTGPLTKTQQEKQMRDDYSTEDDRRRDGDFADRIVLLGAALAFVVLVMLGPGV